MLPRHASRRAHLMNNPVRGSGRKLLFDWLEERTLLSTFSNPAAITIQDDAAAALYPSEIAVSGFPAGSTIDKVTVTIHNFSHEFPDDVDILLVGPSGQNAIIWSDVGGGDAVLAANLVTITLDDAAASDLPDDGPITPGTFRPTNVGGGDAFPAPAPAPVGGSALSTFNGTDPNGTWQLYVVDDASGDVGAIAGGWSLDIATEPVANLSITKTANKDVVIAGEELIYNIHVFNEGPNTALNVVVTDTLPTGVVFLGDTAITNPPGGCTGTTTLACALGNIPAGTARDFQIKTRVPADFVRLEADGTATIINTATVSSVSDIDSSDNTATEATFVEDEADLRVTKFVEPIGTTEAGDPDPANAVFSTFIYTIYVDNFGPSAARNVVIRDTLLNSNKVSIESCAFSVSQGGGAISQFTCDTGDAVSTQFGTDIGTFGTNFLLPAGQDLAGPTFEGRLRASFRLRVNEGADVTNVTQVFSDTFDPVSTNNFASVNITVIPVANLSVTKTATAEEQQVGQAGLMFNNAIFGQAFPTAPNYFASTRVTAGRRIQYTLNVSNTGPSRARNVVVSDLLPEGVRLYQGSLSITKGGVTTTTGCDGGTPGDPLNRIVCGLGTLEAPDATDPTLVTSATITFQVITDASIPAGAVLVNEADVTSDTRDNDNSDNHSRAENTVLAAADLTVTKSNVGENVTGYNATLDRLIENDVAGAVTAGMVLRYEVTVQNNGPSDSQSVTISDALPNTPLPGPLTFLSANGANCRPSAAATDTLSCSVGTLAAGERRTFDIYVRVDPSVPPTTVLENCVTALTGASNTIPPGGPAAPPTGGPTQTLTWDPLITNNTNCTDTTVNTSADLKITKSGVPAKLFPGDELRFHIRVENLGPSAATNVVVTDTLPAGITFEFDTDNCSLASSNPDVVVCSLGTMQPGEVEEFDIWGEVTAATPSGVELCNTASVASTVPPSPATIDFNLTNNTATSCTFTVRGADLAVTKDAPATINPGTNITYVITVSNSGPTSAIGTVLEDFVPDGERILSVTPSSGSCLAGVAGDANRPTTCNLDSIDAGESATVTVVVEANNCLQDLNKLFNDVRVSSDTFDSDNSNNVFHSTTEVRQSANGNVTAVATRGNLLIQGDKFNNTIRISPALAADPFALRITPFGGTRVNGECRSVQVHGIKGTVSIIMGRSNDGVFFDTFEGSPVQLRKTLSILTGVGNDTVEMNQTRVAGKTTIREDGDQDHVTILDAVLSSLSVRVGKADDGVRIEGTEVTGAASIRSDGSADEVVILDSHFHSTLLVQGGLSFDLVSIVDSIFDGKVTLRGGANIDTLDAGILTNPNANGNSFNGGLKVQSFENVIS
jgi:uncharacterized repeat protein (TIGR01451 family)